jgi:rhamnosyltransferase subunit B
MAHHYLVISVGTYGDIHPFMCIARALQSLGRQVTFISHSPYASLAREAGLPFIGIGTDEDYYRVLNNPDLWDPIKGIGALFERYGEGTSQILDAIGSVAPAKPLVVIGHPFAIPGAAIARDTGLVQGLVGAFLAPSNLKTCYDPLTVGPTTIPSWVPMRWRRALWHVVEKWYLDPATLPQLNAIRAAWKLPAVGSFLGQMANSPDLTLTLFPAWFGPAKPDWPQPIIQGDFQVFEARADQTLSAELSVFLSSGEKPLVFTPGSGNLHAHRFFACALAAVQKIGKRAIFLTRERAQVPITLPNTVLWQAYVPLGKLLPYADMFVHHGGIGSTAEALRAGIPQLITPYAWDQFDNGERIRLLGVGAALPAKKLRAGKLARTLQSLGANNALRANCALQAQRFTPPHDPVALCLQVEAALTAQLTASMRLNAGPIDVPSA